MSRRTIAILATTALLVATVAVVSATFFMNQTSTKPPESGYWILDISPSNPTFSTGYVQPNGTVHVPMNQTGITVTAAATGINGFMYWRLDGEIMANQSSTIFVPKQSESSNHTLVAVFVIGTPVISPSPSSSASPFFSGEKQEVDVLAIGKKYVEETYGTDYALNGDVSETSFSNGTGSWTYPSASFRVPADWQKAGTLVTVMVNPETGEIFKVLTNWSKSMLPPATTPLAETSPHYLQYPNGNESRIFLVSATSTYGVYPLESVPQMGSSPAVQKGDASFIINVTVRNDYTLDNLLPTKKTYQVDTQHKQSYS
jgi:hypothetical protein